LSDVDKRRRIRKATTADISEGTNDGPSEGKLDGGVAFSDRLGNLAGCRWPQRCRIHRRFIGWTRDAAYVKATITDGISERHQRRSIGGQTGKGGVVFSDRLGTPRRMSMAAKDGTIEGLSDVSRWYIRKVYPTRAHREEY
jgi:hypothetical protein